jgi:VWFA-related protein
MSPTPKRLACLLALGTLWLVFSSTAQDTPTTDTIFSEILEVRVVNLEVVVEDKDGNRVPDLKPADFQLLVDGQELPIDYFTEIRGGQVAVPGRSTQEAGGPRAVPGLPAGERLGTSYLVFIDDFFTVAPSRNRAIDGIREAVSLLGHNDRMAVVAFDGRRLDMLTSWSQSPADLQEVLDEAKDRRAWGRHTALLLGGNTSREAATRGYEQRLSDMATAVRSTLRSFAQPPGRKVMMLLAGQWPYSPSTYLSGDSFDEDSIRNDTLRRSYRVFEPIYQTANRLGYTLYPIDSGGIQGGGIDMSRARQRRPIASLAPEQEIHSTLQVLAGQTGGQALLDGGRTDSLERVVADTRSYYWLGFTPDWRGDDAVHDVKIQVLREGLKVRTRESYQDLSRAREVGYMVESALLFDDVPWAAPLTVKKGKPYRHSGKRMLPLEVQVPLDQVTFLPDQGNFLARLELRLVSMDDRGHRSEVDVLPFSMSGPRPPAPGETGVQKLDVQMRRGKHDLVVALHDPLSGKIFTTRLEVKG